MFQRTLVALFWLVAVGLSPASHGAQFAYVTGNDAVSVIDTAINAVVARVPVRGAGSLVVDPAGAFVYVAASDFFLTSISALDTATNNIVGRTSLEGVTQQLAVNPSGRYVYALQTAPNSARPLDGWVSVIDTTTHAITATIQVPFAEGIAVNPVRPRAYFATFSSVLVIDTVTNTVITEIFMGSSGVHSIAVNPAGTFLYVVNSGPSNVTVIDTATNAVVKVIPVASVWDLLQFNLTGTVAYVSATSYSIAAIDTATNAVIATIPLGPVGAGVVRRMVLSPDGTTLYASVDEPNGLVLDPSLKVIDTATHAVAQLSFRDPMVAVRSDGTAYVAGDFDKVWVVSGVTHDVTGFVRVIGSAQSVIVGPVVAGPPSIAATPVPALSQWSTIIMGLLLGVLGIRRLRA
jgi:YVTN family beta-propeller protein